MAISAGSAIDDADFGKWFKVVSNSGSLTYSSKGENNLAMPSAPSGYKKIGLYSYSSGNTSVVLRAISDSQITFRNTASSSVTSTASVSILCVTTAMG